MFRRAATMAGRTTGAVAARTFATQATHAVRANASYARYATVGAVTVGAFAAYTLAESPLAMASSVPIYGIPGTNQERTFIAVKPDGVNRNIVGEIISRFERKGYKLVGIKVVQPTKAFASAHYADLSKKKFFPGLVEFFSSSAVVAMVWEGKGAIKGGRVLLGETDPAKSLPGSIRGDLCIDIGRNICHGSDSAEAAKDEISLWFKEGEVVDYARTNDKWLYE